VQGFIDVEFQNLIYSFVIFRSLISFLIFKNMFSNIVDIYKIDNIIFDSRCKLNENYI